MSPHSNLDVIRAREIGLVSELSALVVTAPDGFQAFADRAVAGVADVFEVEYCKVLELLPGREELLLRAGVGWLPGLVGVETVGTEWQSQAGYTLLQKAPVIVRDLNRERRFTGPPLLHLHRVVSGLSVIIPGSPRPWGVLGVHATRFVPFDETDGQFMLAIANLISIAAASEARSGAAEADTQRAG